MCRTWNRFVTMDDTRVNKQIFLNDYYSNIETWSSDFFYVCFTLGFEQYYENLLEIDLKCFKEKLDIFAQEKCLESVNSKPKLRTYKKYKTKLSQRIMY